MDSSSSAAQAAAKWYRTEARVKPRRNLVAEVLKRIASATDLEEKKTLKYELVSEHQWWRDFRSSENTLKEIAEDYPCNPMPLLMLAEQLHHLESKPYEALKIANEGLARAECTASLRRHALAVKARIFLDLGRYKDLDACLMCISRLDLGIVPTDVGKERDFFDKADKSRLSPSTVKSFEAYLKTDT